MTTEVLEEKIQAIQVTLSKIEEKCESNTRRIDGAEEKIAETFTLVTAIKELAIETKYMREDLNNTINRLNKLEASNITASTEELKLRNIELQKQADKWEKFKWLLVAGIITVIIGFIATTLKLK
jgi:seryl-tRNA synthetase